MKTLLLSLVLAFFLAVLTLINPAVRAQPDGGPQGGPPGVLGDARPPGVVGQYKDIVPALLDALADADAGVRQLAASSLVKIGSDAVGPLAEALKTKDRETRANAAYVLDGRSLAEQIAAHVAIAVADGVLNLLKRKTLLA